jgi:cell division protein FtsA
MAKQDRYVVGLDIGTTKTCAIIGEIHEDGRLDIVGIGSCASRGLRKGVVVNLDATVEAIKKATEEAELMSGVGVEKVYVGIAGSHIKGFNSRGVVAVSSKDREITREDIQRVIDAAKAVSIPQDREILHVLPQEFIVDEQDGIGDPLGMSGTRLEANVHIITGAITSAQNIITCVNRAGIEVADTVLQQLASAESILTPDEKELGVALVDVGGGTTDLAIFEKGAIWHTAVLAIGGEHFTNDIAVGLRTPVAEAEKIKKKHGVAMASLVEESDTIEVPSVGGRKPRIVSRRMLCEIIQPRAEEVLHLVHDEIRRAGYEKTLNSGLVLTGGGAIMEGVPEMAEQIFDLPVRRGTPQNLSGLVDVVSSPVFATAVGLVSYGYQRRLQLRKGRQQSASALAKIGSRLKNWLSDFF